VCSRQKRSQREIVKESTAVLLVTLVLAFLQVLDILCLLASIVTVGNAPPIGTILACWHFETTNLWYVWC
jgi:hypothetical protein